MTSSMVFENPYILPSERMAYLRRLGMDGVPKPDEIKALGQGAYICSNCDRCTVVCPAGINLRELWISVREDLVQREDCEPAVLSQFSFVRGLNKDALGSNGQYSTPISAAKKYISGKDKTREALHAPLILNDSLDADGDGKFERDAFLNCFGCRNCTSVCPVVCSYEEPEEKLGLLPHQIMCSLGLGLTEAAVGAEMLWECSTCYQCQEHCPQGVAVTDLLYDLKNMAIRNRSELCK
jgi:heterodisulfide reductase subunit C